MNEIRQYFTEESVARPDGTVEIRRSFTDHFGDDLDVYICRSMEQCYQEDRYEDPEVAEAVLQHDAEVDAECDDEPWEHDSLLDLADDGTVYAAVADEDDDETEEES